MTAPSSFRPVLGGIVVVALLGALLTSVSIQTAAAGPGYQQPTKGDCRNLSSTQFRARSNSSKPVSCAATHTTQTVYVGKLPKRLSWKSARSRINDAIERRCQQAWNDAVGRSAKLRALSAFSLATFEPTKAQKRKGARWFRCDAGLLRSSALSPLTTTTSPLLKKPAPPTQARCLTTADRVTTCDAGHEFKATHAFKPKGKAYPGRKRIKRIATKGCRDRVSTASFRFEWPNRGEWADRNRFVVCYSAKAAPAPPSDELGPELLISNPGFLLDRGEAFNIAGSTEDPATIASIRLRLRNGGGQYLQDNGAWGSSNDLDATLTGIGTTRATFAFNAGTSLARGTYTVLADATDTLGNTTGVTKAVRVDDVAPDPVVYYRMDEGPNATTMNDSGGYNLDGKIDPDASSVGLTTGVVFGGGVTGYSWALRSPTQPPVQAERVVQVTDNDLLDAGPPGTPFTLEIRYRTDRPFGNVIQKGQSESIGGQWKVEAPEGRPSCLFKDGAGNRSAVRVPASHPRLDDNQWHTLKCQRNADYVTMWVDGVKLISNSAANVGTINSSIPLTIGGKLNCDQVETTCDYFTGQIDFVRLSHG